MTVLNGAVAGVASIAGPLLDNLDSILPPELVEALGKFNLTTEQGSIL
jgi:hypothetical protein